MLNPQLLYETPYKIWRLQLDGQARFMLLEVRNEEEREVSFTAIDWQGGELLWEDGALEEPWWLSMAAVVDGKLLLHTLHDSQEPSPKGIICLAIEQGEGLWELDGYILQSCHQDYLLCSKEGESVAVSFAGDEMALGNSPLMQPSHSLPFRYLPSDGHFETVAKFLLKKLEITAVGAIDYWETNALIVISYYTINDIYFDNHLLILTKLGEVQLHTLINAKAKGIGTESFGLQADWLFYIANKQQLYRINLQI